MEIVRLVTKSGRKYRFGQARARPLGWSYARSLAPLAKERGFGMTPPEGRSKIRTAQLLPTISRFITGRGSGYNSGHASCTRRQQSCWDGSR